MAWNMPRGDEFLPRLSLDELKQIMAAEKEAKPRTRFLIALHRKQGKSIDEIAEACSVPRRTVHGTLERFRERGSKAAHNAKKPGRPKRLTAKQLRNLRFRLLKSPQKNGFKEGFWNTRMVRELVKREYRVEYTGDHLARLLHRLGFSYKKPRETNPRRASAEEIFAFKKKPVERCWLQNAKEERSL